MGSASQQTAAITHPGVISEIRGGSVRVTLSENPHCDSCQAKGACGMAESGTREVEIPHPGGAFALNDPVQVVLRRGLGPKAVFWAYLFPFLLMVGTLGGASLVFEEWVAGVASLLVLIPYFGMVYLRRNYFKRTFRISILRN